MPELPEEIGKSGFTLRAVLVAVILAVLLAASSIYISLSLGAMPWPVILSVIASGALLRLLGIFKPTNIHEINVAQAGASIGGVLASAAAFTIPGIWFLMQKGVPIEPLPTISVILVCILGGFLGVLLSIPVRRAFIDEEQLPFASGKAAAEVLKAGDAGGRKAFVVLVAASLAGLFMLATYFFGVPVVSFSELATFGLLLSAVLFIAPLAAGVGFILGPRIAVASWFGGALVGWGILVPLLFSQGIKLGDASAMVQNLGMGILLGSGVGFLISYLVPNAKKIFLPMFSGGPWYVRITPIFSVAAAIILWLLGVPILASVLAVLGVWVVVSVAGRMTGETDIDPYEQFGIIAVVSIALIFALLSMNLGYAPSFLIVTFVTVAAAVVGDIGFDYKSAKILGTKAIDMVKVDLVAVVFAGIATPFILGLVRKSYSSQLFTPAMPATQATLVAGSIGGFSYPFVFLLGFATALAWELGMARLLKQKPPVSAMAFGIGAFIGFALSIPFALGGLIRFIVDKKRPSLSEIGMLAAAGAMAGIGVGGFARGSLLVMGISGTDAILAAVFGILLAIGLAKLLKK